MRISDRKARRVLCSQFPDDVRMKSSASLAIAFSHARERSRRAIRKPSDRAETFVPNPKLDVAKVLQRLRWVKRSSPSYRRKACRCRRAHVEAPPRSRIVFEITTEEAFRLCGRAARLGPSTITR